LEDPDIQHIMITNGPFRGIRTYVGQTADSHLLPPPHFGEHTLSILQELLKISPGDVNSLALKGVIR